MGRYVEEVMVDWFIGWFAAGAVASCQFIVRLNGRGRVGHLVGVQVDSAVEFMLVLVQSHGNYPWVEGETA